MGSSLGRFRVHIFRYSSTSPDGFLQTEYVYLYTRWASWRDTGGQATVTGGRAEREGVRKFVIDRETVVPDQGLLVVVTDGACYKVLNASYSPQTRKRIVTTQWVDAEQVRKTGQPGG